MNSTTKQVNVSEEAYTAIYQAIEQVYERTQKKPKYSEVQAIYKTSNSYIQVVMADWLEKHQAELTKPSEVTQKPIQLDEATLKALSNSFIAEVQRAKEQAELELEQERQALYEIRDEAVEEAKAQMRLSDEYFEENERLKKELETLHESQKELDRLQSRYEEAQNRISRLESELEAKNLKLNKMSDDSLLDKQRIAELTGTIKALQKS